MVSACSRAGRRSTRAVYRPKFPKADSKAAASAHQEKQHEQFSNENERVVMLKPDHNEPTVNPPPGLECVPSAKQIQEEVLDQVAPEHVRLRPPVEPPPGLERVAGNLPATPESTDPSQVQEAISESDNVATVTENLPYPLHVKDVSECAACSSNVLAPLACCVSIEGLPKAILCEPMMLATLQQAGFLKEVITFSTCKGDPCGEAHVSFSSVDAALRCVYHFQGCQWDASGTEVTAKMTPLESSESMESLDYALGMDAAIDYVCCSAMDGEEQLGAMTQEQACEILQEHLGAMTREQCEILQEHLSAMTQEQACEIIPEHAGATTQKQACEIFQEHPGAMTQEQACEILQEHLGAMTHEQACEILQEHLGAMALEEAGEALPEHAGAKLSAEAAEFIPFNTESQQPQGVLRADAPDFEAMPSDSIFYETFLPEAYEMVDAEACDFMTVHRADCMGTFAVEAHNTLLSADSPPFVPILPTLVAARAELGLSAKDEGQPAAAVPTTLGVSSDTSTELGESDVDDDKGGLVV